MSIKQVDISLVGCCIQVKNVNPNNSYENYNLLNVKSVVPTFLSGYGTRSASTNQRKNPYHHDDKIILAITFIGESGEPSLQFDIQDVSNQPGWTANIAGLDQATADVCSWIAACIAAGGGGGGDATEATLSSLEQKTAGSLVNVDHDQVVIAYVVAGNGIGEILTATYKLATVTVATLTNTYDGSNRLIDVIRT
ncbi:MAG: hypothetical protein COA88_12835 [Kordia sp.]|jgi:hypothetical protein|nr:MAG: hypothetical protein COA88_12835 [Kordia sp.]